MKVKELKEELEKYGDENDVELVICSTTSRLAMHSGKLVGVEKQSTSEAEPVKLIGKP